MTLGSFDTHQAFLGNVEPQTVVSCKSCVATAHRQDGVDSSLPHQTKIDRLEKEESRDFCVTQVQ